MLKKVARLFEPRFERLENFVKEHYEQEVGSLLPLHDIWVAWRVFEGDSTERAEEQLEDSDILSDMLHLGYRVALSLPPDRPDAALAELVGWRAKARA